MTRLTAMACIVAASIGGNPPPPNTWGESLSAFDRNGHKVAQFGWNSWQGSTSPLCYIGDVEQVYNSTYLHVGDFGKIVHASAPDGRVVMGDPNQIVNGTKIIVDDHNQIIVLNRPFLMQSPNGHWWRFACNDKGELVSKDAGLELP